MSMLCEFMKERAIDLLQQKKIDRIVGWKKGEFYFDNSPAVFESASEIEQELVYNGFCGANLSKHLIEVSKKEGITGVFLKPCDTLSFNQLIKEHRIDRKKVYAIGIECNGKLDVFKMKDQGADAITSVSEQQDKIIAESIYGQNTFDKESVLLEKCLSCKGKTYFGVDEKIITSQQDFTPSDRFSKVKELEKMTESERFAFWKSQLSKCIRCNACRNVCPACSCVKCVFDNVNSGVSAKANDSEFEEKLYHIIRAFHVAGRCTDCGECSRVCPQRIPLHLLNRKFIKDINEFYGEYQAGEETQGATPLTQYLEKDVEPSDAVKGEQND